MTNMLAYTAPKKLCATIVTVFLFMSPVLYKSAICHGIVRNSKHTQSHEIVTKKVTVVLKSTSVKNAVHALANRANIPIGFVGVSGEDGKPKQIMLRAVQETVGEILDYIVKADDRYKWEVVGGIINVSPVLQTDCISELRIDYVRLHEVEILSVGSAILDSPRVRKELQSRGKLKTDELNYSGRPIKNAKISTVLSDTTIRDGLNTFLSSGYARFWAIETFGIKDEFVRIILFD